MEPAVKRAVITIVLVIAALRPAAAVASAAPEREVRAGDGPTVAPRQAPEGRRGAAGVERRRFAIPSARAWRIVRARLQELGLSIDKTDARRQVALTDWKKLDRKAPEWLLVAPLPAQTGLKDVRAQFLVFVSPFAADAHVSVGSVVDGVPYARHTVTYYNVASLNRALMGELASVLDQEAQAAGSTPLPRAVPEVCTVPPGAPDPAPPERIALSKFEFVYPEAALEHRTESPIRVGFTILEDGSVTDLRVVSEDVGDQLEGSALGVSSLMLFVPARHGTTCIRTQGTITVHYRILPTPPRPR